MKVIKEGNNCAPKGAAVFLAVAKDYRQPLKKDFFGGGGALNS